MNIDAFRRSLSRETPPPSLSPLLEALWWAGKALGPGTKSALAPRTSAEDSAWNRSHDGLQNIETPEGCWVHAHLHRQEGDLANARYWYKRGGREPSEASLDAEWQEIAGLLLADAAD
jgi:hypothetical protein